MISYIKSFFYKKPICKVDSDGTKIWYLNGKRHREDGPAVEYSDGTKCWLVNDKLHRTDGPAIESANGTKKWLVNGKLHRTDGPAVESANGTKTWWVNGKEYSFKEWLKLTPLSEEDKVLMAIYYG